MDLEASDTREKPTTPFGRSYECERNEVDSKDSELYPKIDSDGLWRQGWRYKAYIARGNSALTLGFSWNGDRRYGCQHKAYVASTYIIVSFNLLEFHVLAT